MPDEENNDKKKFWKKLDIAFIIDLILALLGLTDGVCLSNMNSKKEISIKHSILIIIIIFILLIAGMIIFAKTMVNLNH